MRRCAGLLGAILLLGLLGGGRLAFGDNLPGKEISPLPQEILEKLRPTTEQRDRIKELQKEYDDKGKTTLAKARAAFEKKDKKALEKLKRTAEKHRDELEARLMDLLSEEQKAELKELRNGRPGSMELSPADQEKLNLTPAQKAKLAQLQQEWDAKLLQMEQELRAKKVAILTEEQRKKLRELKKE